MLKHILCSHYIYPLFFLFSATLMILIDYRLAEKAEFLNFNKENQK